MIGTKFQKPLQNAYLVDEYGKKIVNTASNTLSKYSECAQWCNANHAMIVDKGDYYEVVPVPEPTTEELAEQVRSKRDVLIAETDYLLAPDYPISQEDLETVKVYRQALRDVPQQATFPDNVIWPEKPTVRRL